MTDRADALAYRIIEGWNSDGVLTEGRSKHALASEIVTALRTYAEEARREEREACAKLIEDHGHSNGRIRASHRHLAAAIRARGEKG